MQDDTVKETTMADEALADVPMPRGREFNKFSLVHRVYYACRDGFSRLLLATLKDIDCEHDRKAIVDQNKKELLSLRNGLGCRRHATSGK
ncbi:hypothetical protein quinque_003081 [Culex quinquefasciatus]